MTAASLLPDTPGLVRDEEEHVYRFDGNVVPGITRLMEPIHSYDGVPDWRLERKAELGSFVHLATELHDLGTLDEDSVHSSIRPYLDGWRQFRLDHPGQIHAIEPKLYHASLGFAGQPDRCMAIETDMDVVEIKTTAQLYNAVGVQLAAQDRLLSAVIRRRVPGASKRFAVQLLPSGRYVLREYRAATDWPTFLSLLTVHNWMARFGNQ